MSDLKDISKTTLRDNWKALTCCCIIAMAPFQYGIDFGMIGGLQAMVGFLQVFGYVDPSSPIGYNISPTVQQLISSLMTLGAVVGSLLCGPVGAYVSRRQGLWLATVACYVANTIMMATTDIGAVYFARLLIGIANGFFQVFAQLYLQESAPPHLRGLAIAIYQWWCSLGSLIGTIVDNFTAPLPGRQSYLIPLGLIYIIPAILSVLIIFLPESPRWLAQKGKNEQARKALIRLRPSKLDPQCIEDELHDIKVALEIEREISRSTSALDMFRNPIDRRRTGLAVGSVALQGASGAMFMLVYGTYFFTMADMSQPFLDSVILSVVGLVVISVAFIFVRYFGRRKILMVGMTFSGIAMLVQAAVYQHSPGTVQTGKVIVGMAVLYIIFYNGCVSAFAWMVGGEIPAQHLRSYTLGLASAVGFILGWLAAYTAPYFINPDDLNWGPKYGYIWFGSNTLAVVWIFFFLPETKDRTLEELDEMFAANVPARKFATYKCSNLRIGDIATNEKETLEHVEIQEVDPAGNA